MAFWNKNTQEEPNAPMHCPWCGGEMVRGYLSSGRDAVYFSEEKPGMVEYLMVTVFSICGMDPAKPEPVIRAICGLKFWFCGLRT